MCPLWLERKLTQNQPRRINQKYAKTFIAIRKKDIEWSQMKCLANRKKALWSHRYSIHADVENEQGEIYLCNLRQTLSSFGGGR